MAATGSGSTQGVRVLAVDLGASSGRVLAASLTDVLQIEEVSRFETPWKHEGGFERWDLDALTACIRGGIEKAGLFDSVGVDTWGVDFGLVGEDGAPIANPIRYRDASHAPGFEALGRCVPDVELYSQTGIQPMPFNTSGQLLARKMRGDEELRKAKSFALMPDLVGSQLSGSPPLCEATNASTTQLLGLDGEWCPLAVEASGGKASFMPDLTSAGSVAGEISGKPLIRVCSHDTASAVLATPQTASSAFISSGTWSVVGVELLAPCATEAALRAKFSNERGYEGSYRFVRNLTGLWLLQRCQEGRPADECIRLAKSAPAFGPRFETNHPSLLNPANMSHAIRALADGNIASDPALLRAIFENLAASYARTLRKVEALTGRTLSHTSILGGGCQNDLLNQMTADASGLPVSAGPVEATAIGNALGQFSALGRIRDPREEGRLLVAESFKPKVFEPQNHERWLEWMNSKPVESH